MKLTSTTCGVCLTLVSARYSTLCALRSTDSLCRLCKYGASVEATGTAQRLLLHNDNTVSSSRGKAFEHVAVFLTAAFAVFPVVCVFFYDEVGDSLLAARQ